VLTIGAQTIMFLSSFAPLLFVFGLLDSFGLELVRWLCYVIGGLAILGLIGLFQIVERLAEQSIQVDSAKPRDTEAIAYVVTYLLPFLTINSTAWQSRVATAVFVLIVGILYVRSHIFYVNPLLSLAGYRLFEIRAGKGFVLLLTRREFLAPGTAVRARRVSSYVYWERRLHGNEG
jgi:hypothetical protein